MALPCRSAEQARPLCARLSQDEAGALQRLRAAQQTGVLRLARCGLAHLPDAVAALAAAVRVADVSRNKVGRAGGGARPAGHQLLKRCRPVWLCGQRVQLHAAL